MQRGYCSTPFRRRSPNVKLPELSAPYSSWSAGFIDYDNNGCRDLYRAKGGLDNIKPNARLRGSQPRQTGTQRIALVVADFNGDGKRDLAIASALAVGAFNADGLPGLVVANSAGNLSVLLNTTVHSPK